MKKKVFILLIVIIVSYFIYKTFFSSKEYISEFFAKCKRDLTINVDGFTTKEEYEANLIFSKDYIIEKTPIFYLNFHKNSTIYCENTKGEWECRKLNILPYLPIELFFYINKDVFMKKELYSGEIGISGEKGKCYRVFVSNDILPRYYNNKTYFVCYNELGIPLLISSEGIKIELLTYTTDIKKILNLLKVPPERNNLEVWAKVRVKDKLYIELRKVKVNISLNDQIEKVKIYRFYHNMKEEVVFDQCKISRILVDRVYIECSLGEKIKELAKICKNIFLCRLKVYLKNKDFVLFDPSIYVENLQ